MGQAPIRENQTSPHVSAAQLPAEHTAELPVARPNTRYYGFLRLPATSRDFLELSPEVDSTSILLISQLLRRHSHRAKGAESNTCEKIVASGIILDLSVKYSGALSLVKCQHVPCFKGFNLLLSSNTQDSCFSAHILTESADLY
jgi:hypothetical protein